MKSMSKPSCGGESASPVSELKGKTMGAKAANTDPAVKAQSKISKGGAPEAQKYSNGMLSAGVKALKAHDSAGKRTL